MRFIQSHFAEALQVLVEGRQVMEIYGNLMAHKKQGGPYPLAGALTCIIKSKWYGHEIGKRII